MLFIYLFIYLHYKHKSVIRSWVADSRYERCIRHSGVAEMDSRQNVAFYLQGSRQKLKECKMYHIARNLNAIFRIVTCSLTPETWNAFIGYHRVS